MKAIRVIIAGAAVTAFDAVAGGILCGVLFNWVYQLVPTNVWRPMEGGPDAIYFLGLFILNIILALVYALLQKGIPGKGKIAKGCVFGLCVWLVGMLPGMFATYTFMTVATTVIVYWLISGLIMTPIRGIIIAAIYGEE